MLMATNDASLAIQSASSRIAHQLSIVRLLLGRSRALPTRCVQVGRRDLVALDQAVVAPTAILLLRSEDPWIFASRL